MDIGNIIHPWAFMYNRNITISMHFLCYLRLLTLPRKVLDISFIGMDIEFNSKYRFVYQIYCASMNRSAFLASSTLYINALLVSLLRKKYGLCIEWFILVEMPNWHDVKNVFPSLFFGGLFCEWKLHRDKNIIDKVKV